MFKLMLFCVAAGVSAAGVSAAGVSAAGVSAAGVSAAGVSACARSHAQHELHHTATVAGPEPDVSVAPLAQTPAGAIRGTWLRTRRARPLQAFRGIRYAEPPVGARRFQPPTPITHYSSEVDATKDGPACPQPTFGDYYVDEDCLRLNVYTPGKASGKPLPVLVYIHAGGFYSLSGRSDVAGPEYLLDRDLVLVTINYRLASLGFLSTGDALAPGNNGFKDQVMALRWVQRNIASFNGDPGLVTISGYSAGAFSVMLHTVSPMSKGLFHRAVSMSGSPISQVQLPSHQKHLAVRQAGLMNCPTNSSKAILDCLKTKSSKELGDSLDNMFDFGYDPTLLWVPIVEPDFGQERFLPLHPLEALQQGRMQAVPYVVSQTQDEFFWKAFSILNNQSMSATMEGEWARIAPIAFYLRPPAARAAAELRRFYLDNKPLTNDSATARNLGKLYNDAIIGFGAHSLANALAEYSGEDTYYYEFGYIGNHSHYEDPVTKKPVGAAHHDDLIYLFSINASFPLVLASDSDDSRMVDQMTAILYNFARFGEPNPRGDTAELSISWPRMERRTRRYLRVDKPFSVREKLFEERFHLWERLYRTDNCAFCTL